MQFNKSLMTATLVTICGFAAMSSVNAAPSAAPNPAISSFNVNLTVNPICTVKASPADVELGNIDAGQATSTVTSQTALVLNCSTGAIANIGLTPASTSSADGTGNLLGGKDSLETIAYKLTSISAEGTAWGSVGNTVATAAALKYATDISTAIFVTVTDDADVTPGAYTDIVEVSVAY